MASSTRMIRMIIPTIVTSLTPLLDCLSGPLSGHYRNQDDCIDLRIVGLLDHRRKVITRASLRSPSPPEEGQRRMTSRVPFQPRRVSDASVDQTEPRWPVLEAGGP